MMADPSMVFSTDPRRGLVARSGWEQEEARTVLRDLGWEWVEELHALVPPDDVPKAEAGLQAVGELHLHGHRTGYVVGAYGTMRLTLDRAEQVFTVAVERQTPRAGLPADEAPEKTSTTSKRPSVYGSTVGPEHPDLAEPDAPAVSPHSR
ncbi:hypothetical protein B7C62_16980 [Kitasatospora albolonga]|uniref:Uncharacterized protein n=1 Tax=Kitasatospora albolonga TaxID=68173 RepID=A0ABC8BVI7_9ACTN|nr:hypothetical protein B7C62_16980 [Kitasatospora albolonga]